MNQNDIENMSPSSMEIARSIEFLVKSGSGKPWPIVFGEFEALEAELLSKASEDWVKLEIRRRIAEIKIRNPFGISAPVEEFETVWRELVSLGFSSLNTEATMNFYRVKFLIYNSSLEESILESLNAIERCIYRFRESGNDGGADHFSKVHKNLNAEYSEKFSGFDQG